MKHQSNCYRNINGKKYLNYCDLDLIDSEIAIVIDEAKKLYKTVKKIKHHSGDYYQLFVSND